MNNVLLVSTSRITVTHLVAYFQGTCPPPKMTSPDNTYFKNNELIEDLDTTGHLEIDATPPIAAKKGRKKQLLSEVSTGFKLILFFYDLQLVRIFSFPLINISFNMSVFTCFDNCTIKILLFLNVY